MRSRISFLTRLVILKLLALFVFIGLAFYTPSTINTLLDGASGISARLAKGLDNSLQFVGASLENVSFLVPRRGAAEFLARVAGMDKVILFIGITIALYLSWLLVVALVTRIVRRRPARLKSVGASGASPPR